MEIRRARVLVVDDAHEQRLMLSSLMSQAGYSVDAVADGNMALVMLRSHPPDLVLLAGSGPQIDGLALCRTIKGDASTERVQVILLRPQLDQAAQRLGLDAGADECLAGDPVSPEALLDVVQQLLHIRDVADHLDVGIGPLVHGLGGRKPLT